MKVKVKGLKELDRALGELPKVTGRNVLRRTAKAALEPFAADARARAPVLENFLRPSIVVSQKLNKRQSRFAKREGKNFVEMYAGTTDPAGIMQEFGNSIHRPQAFMRPAWDANKDRMLELVSETLGAEIAKAAARLGRKAARGG